MMLKNINSRWGRFILLLPVVFLVLNAFYFKYAAMEIQEVMLNEKFIEIMVTIDALATAVNANPEISWLEYEDMLRSSVEFIDQLYQIYAELYVYKDGNLLHVSERYYESSPIEPFDFGDFYEVVFTQENGQYIINYTPENQASRELHLYYRWMPTYRSECEGFLVIGGVSSQSITNSISLWVSAGQWLSMSVTFALNMWMVMLIVRLGSVYEKRDCDNKWRKETNNND